jgi:hypothetical protein
VFTVDEREVQGTLTVVAGDESVVGVEFNTPYGAYTTSSSIVVTKTVDLVLTDSSQIVVKNNFASVALLQANIKNTALFSTYATFSVYVINTTSEDIPVTNNTISVIRSIPNLVLITSLPLTAYGSSIQPIDIFAKLEVGTRVYCFVVETTVDEEYSTQNNGLCASLTFLENSHLQINAQEIVADTNQGTIRVALYNIVNETTRDVRLNVYGYDENTGTNVYTLLGVTTPIDIQSSSMRIVVLDAINFSSVDEYTYSIIVELPADYSPTGAVAQTKVLLKDAKSNVISRLDGSKLYD